MNKPIQFLFILCMMMGVPDCMNGNRFNGLERPALQLIVFEGSDWCSNCRHFERYVLSDSLFQSFLSTQQIELVKVDFPQRKKLDATTLSNNKKLASQYQFDGSFPTIILARKDTLLFRRIHYSQKSKVTIIEELETLMPLLL